MRLRSPGFMFYAVAPSEHAYARMEDVPPHISDAIPWFIILIVIELLVSVMQGVVHRRHNVKDMFCSVSLGLFQQIASIPFAAMASSVYASAYEHCRLFTVPYDSALAWWGLMLGVDLGYYALHRWCHEFHLGWIGHSCHHSGEFYNLATALRQGTLQSLASSFFYLPLALLGLPLPMFMTHKALNLLYQFWIHTETIGDLGPLEYILNTPSHHRLHHRPGANVNYAGVLIIWDRMFGTFRAEGEGQLDRYGLGKPLNTFDPVRANFEYIRRASESIGWVRPMLPWRRRLAPKWSFRPLDVFRPLEYEASGERRRDADRRSNAIRGRGRPALWYRPALWAPPDENAARQKYVGSMPPFRHRGAIEASYLGAHLLVLLVGHHCFEELMRQPGSTSDPATYALALWLLASLCALGRLSDGDASGVRLEWVRLALLAPTLLLVSQRLGGGEPAGGAGGSGELMIVAIALLACAVWSLIGSGWWLEEPTEKAAKLVGRPQQLPQRDHTSQQTSARRGRRSLRSPSPKSRRV